MRIYVGIHSIPRGVEGLAIRAATEARCRPPWVLDAAHAATHAFVCWRHSDDLAYRLDAVGGHGAKLRTWECRQDEAWPHPFALYEITDGDAHAGWLRCAELVGMPYNYLEALIQPIPILAREPLIGHAMICSRLCVEVLASMGGIPAMAAAALPDLFPERLGRVMQDAHTRSDGWCRRVA